jgi:hypothetical protein
MDFHRYNEYCTSHDVQMLAMLSIILLRAFTLPSDTGKHFIYSLEVSLLIILQHQIHHLVMALRHLHQSLKEITSH